MAGGGGSGRWATGRARRALLVVCAGVCAAGSAGLAGCDRAAPERSAGATPGVRQAAEVPPAQVRQLLDRRARAVLAHDERGYLATGGAGEDRAAARRSAAGFRNLADVPLRSWSYRITGYHGTGGTARVDAQLQYRIDGYDHAPVATARTLQLHRHGGRWYVTSDRPGAHGAQQLWEQGPVTALTGAHSLVLGVGQDRARLADFASLADRAVPAVRGAWGTGWPGHVVVEVPASLAGMAGLLAASPAGYRGIAAVTTGEIGGSAQAPADRIIVNPDAYRELGGLGRQVVLTHEATHVATRASTSPATPLWLSEGYADWVGYRGTGRTAAQAAPELARAVRGGRLPAALPNDADFRFSRQADSLAEAYEGGWLACRMIADHWGAAHLNAFYRAVGAHTDRAGAVDGGLRDVLGISRAQFTARWRAYLRRQLG